MQINELSKKFPDAQSVNQTVRWVTTKDKHASDVITTVSEVRAQQIAPFTIAAPACKARAPPTAAAACRAEQLGLGS